MPNVIAAFQINEKEDEFEDKVKDLGIPEHKEHYKDKKLTQILINTHKSFKRFLVFHFLCILKRIY